MLRRALDDAAVAYVLRDAMDCMLLFRQREIGRSIANLCDAAVVSHSDLCLTATGGASHMEVSQTPATRGSLSPRLLSVRDIAFIGKLLFVLNDDATRASIN